MFSAWEDFDFSEVPKGRSPDGLEEKSWDFFLPLSLSLVTPITSCHPSHHQTRSQGDLCCPRAVSQVDHQAPCRSWQGHTAPPCCLTLLLSLAAAGSIHPPSETGAGVNAVSCVPVPHH